MDLRSAASAFLAGVLALQAGALALPAGEPQPAELLGRYLRVRAGTNLAGDNYVEGKGGGWLVLPRDGSRPHPLEVPHGPAVPGQMGITFQVVYGQGEFWTEDGRQVLRYDPGTRAWWPGSTPPVAFSTFVPLMDGSLLLQGTQEPGPVRPDGSRGLRHRALLERWDGERLETLLPYPDWVHQRLHRDPDYDLHLGREVHTFFDLAALECQEQVLLYGPYTGFLAVFRPGSGLKLLDTPWKSLKFEDLPTHVRDRAWTGKLGLTWRAGDPVQWRPVVVGPAPEAIQFVPTTPGRMRVVYRETRPPGEGPGEAPERAFELDLITRERFPAEVPGPLDQVWAHDDRRGLLRLEELLRPPAPDPASKAPSPGPPAP